MPVHSACISTLRAHCLHVRCVLVIGSRPTFTINNLDRHAGRELIAGLNFTNICDQFSRIEQMWMLPAGHPTRIMQLCNSHYRLRQRDTEGGGQVDNQTLRRFSFLIHGEHRKYQQISDMGVYLANHDARAAVSYLECGACTDWTG
jgi:hypothetical protein